MSELRFIGSIVIGGLLLCLIGVSFGAWLDTIPPKNAKGYVRIRFSVFSKLYAVCPDNYRLEDGKVYYPATKQYLYFSYLSWLRYCFFSFMHKRQSSIASRKKDTRIFLESALADIEAQKEKAARDMLAGEWRNI